MNTNQKEVRIDVEWSLLFRVGALAAWITALLIPIAIASHIMWPPPPWVSGTAADWFAYIQGNPLAGLLNLDFAMEIGLILSVPLYLALFIVLRQTNRSLMVLAISIALLGTLLHLLSNTSLEMLMLSQSHATSTTDAQRAIFLAAGEASLSAYYGMVFQISYVLGYLAYVLIGYAMLKSKVFNRATAILGIVTGIAGFGFYLPKIGILLSVFVVLLIGFWNVMVGRRLFQLGNSIPK